MRRNPADLEDQEEREPSFLSFTAKTLFLCFITVLIIYPDLFAINGLLELIPFIDTAKAEQLIAPLIPVIIEHAIRPDIAGIPFMTLPLAIAWIFILGAFCKNVLVRNAVWRKSIDSLLVFLDQFGYLVLGLYFTLIAFQYFEAIPNLLEQIPMFKHIF